MSEASTIICAFCAGRGTNPFYRGTCPVCKGRGKNEVTTPFLSCTECRGSGKKSGTTLTCFSCRGVGIVPDTREVIKKARSEIKEIQKEMAEEVNELYGKINKKAPETTKRKDTSDGGEATTSTPPRWRERKQKETLEERKESREKCFCQSCAQEVHQGSAYKVCEKCFFLYKFGEVREIKPKEEDET